MVVRDCEIVGRAVLVQTGKGDKDLAERKKWSGQRHPTSFDGASEPSSTTSPPRARGSQFLFDFQCFNEVIMLYDKFYFDKL